MASSEAWWQNTTIYQIYPRSFKDSNADGIGDIPGIIEKLDYIRDLGFETIWCSPFFASPQQDWGYDVSGYREIAPEYGTMADAERLIEEVHTRGMKLIFDLVMNHTSIEHPWFVESSSSRDNPKSDWYIWRDGKGPNRPPNNWKSLPGGSGWHYHAGRGQWYYASFLPFQPDLNFRNPAVKAEMFRVAKFWLDKGVDGYRLDIFHCIYKADHFKDNPFHWSFLPKDDRYGFFTEWKYTINQPETIELAHELRELSDSYSPPRLLLGEIFGEDQRIRTYLGDGTDGMHLMFLWDMMEFDFSARFFRQVIAHHEQWYPQPYTPVYVLGNHDSMRWIERVDHDLHKAKLVVLLQLTTRGVPVVYYGEEIGLPEGQRPAKTALDPVGRRYAWAPNWLLDVLKVYVNRDNCRTPMQWENQPGAGFTGAETAPWLPFSGSFTLANAADQQSDPDSLLRWYQALLHLRSDSPVLQSGTLALLPESLTEQGVLGYFRQAGDHMVLVLLNFGDKAVEVNQPTTEAALTTGEVLISGETLKLGGLSGGVFRVGPER